MVTTAKQQNTIWEFQLLEQTFHVLQHFLVAFLGVLWCVDTNNFHLRELMQTIQATHILTVRACLTTETFRVCAVLDREVLLVENYVTIDVCDRYLSSWNQIEVIHFAMVHLSFLVWKLTCAVARSSIHHRWRHDFCVARLACFIEEEIDKCTLETSTLTFIYREACARNLHTEVEVDEVVFLGKFPMWQLSFCILGNGSPISYSVSFSAFTQTTLNHTVILCAFAFRNVLVRNIWNGAEVTIQRITCLIEFLLEFSSGFLQLCHFCLGSFSSVFLSTLHELSNLSSIFLTFSKDGIEFLLCFTTFFVDIDGFFYSLFCTWKTFLFQSTNDLVGLFRNEF